MTLSQSSKDVLKWFEQLSLIPRKSKQEQQVKQWLKSWSSEHNFTYYEDKAGNALIDVPGNHGHTGKPIIIQGHLDMVCEKTPDSNHDFNKDPLKLVYDGDWLKATKTSLGSDNGIGVALAMAAAIDKTMKRPPLQLLFTIDEETGLTGALQLDTTLLKGDILVNIDSEEEGVFIIGCAGGQDGHVKFPLATQIPPISHTTYELKVDGLRGGHSGIDIHRERGNAIKVLFRLYAELSKTCELQIAHCTAGTAHNAIPRSATMTLTCDAKNFASLQHQITKWQATLLHELQYSDPDIILSLKPLSQNPDKIWSSDLAKRFTDFVIACPFGAGHMSLAVAGVVETSNNLAKIEQTSDTLEVLTSQRSSLQSRLDQMTQRIQSAAHLAQAEFSSDGGYPPWQPKWESQLLKTSLGVFKDIFGRDAKVEVIHAGLECGIISDRCPEMEMISFGPTIRNAHSPDEMLYLPDVEKIWKLLVGLLGKFA